MSGTSSHLISVLVIFLALLSTNHMLGEKGLILTDIIPTGEDSQLDSFGMTIFLAGSMRLAVSLGMLFLVKISRHVGLNGEK